MSVKIFATVVQMLNQQLAVLSQSSTLFVISFIDRNALQENRNLHRNFITTISHVGYDILHLSPSLPHFLTQTSSVR